jgi:hypothetical protein
MKKVINRSFLYWLPMPVIGMLNGMFRGFVLSSFLSDSRAHQVSSVLLIGLIALYVNLIFQKIRIRNLSEAWLTGVIWSVLTIAFEFGLGYFILHTSMRSMIEQYNVAAGNFWPFIVISLLVMPVLFWKYRNRYDMEGPGEHG